jgi:CotH kinase protein
VELRLFSTPRFMVFYKNLKFSHKLILVFLFGLSLSCKKPTEIVTNKSEKSFKSFGFKIAQNPQLPQEIFCEIKSDTIFAVAFSGTDLSALKPSYLIDGKEVTINNQPQTSEVNAQNFTKPITYTIKAEDGSLKNYTIKFIDTQLPVVNIFTNNVSIQNKETYISGTIKIKKNITGDSLFGGALEIRGRGNSTWGFPKKPYKIKLAKKAKLLGMNEAKQWVLLANYADKSLLRNELGFELSRRLNLAYTPASQMVDVILNGKYIGNYELVEQIEVGPNKVNIVEQPKGNTNLDDITGGYLIEADGFAKSEKINFTTAIRMDISVHYPDDKDISAQQITYIKSQIDNFETALFSNNFDDPMIGYRKFFDVDSYINFYLVNEIIGNPDLFWSNYLYKNKNNEKWFSGPVWDMDIAASNDIRIGDTQQKLMINVGFEPKNWINRLMKDKYFRNKIRLRWNEIKGEKLNSVTLFIDQKSKELQFSQQKNFQQWPILNQKVYNNIQALGSFEAEVNYLKNYYQKRLIWLDSQFNSYIFD